MKYGMNRSQAQHVRIVSTDLVQFGKIVGCLKVIVKVALCPQIMKRCLIGPTRVRR